MIDLHLHLDGSMSAEDILFLARENDVLLPSYELKDIQALISAPKDTQSLNDYLKAFEYPIKVMQSKSALSYAVYSLIKRLVGQKMAYAEIRFAPQFHTEKGLTQSEMVEAAIKGKVKAEAECEMRANLILCCMRGKGNSAENEETLCVAKSYLGAGVCAVDLAGAEGIFKTQDYRELFELVREMGLPYTIHAGEADGVSSIEAAIRFGTKRIGHGVRCAESEALMEEIAKRGIALELCPTSNIHTHAVEDIKSYPIRDFLKRGIKATVNTDNMTVSSTTISQEFALLRQETALTRGEEKQLLINSARAAFLTEPERNKLLEKIEIRMA